MSSSGTTTGSGRTVFRLTLLGTSLISLAVVLKELGAFLGRMESADQAFGAGVFTGFATSTADLRAAAGRGGVWSSSNEFAARASEIVRWHLTVDLVYAVLVGMALFGLLSAVTTVTGSPRDLARSSRYLLGVLAGDLRRRQWSVFVRDLDAIERRHLVFLLPTLYVVTDLVENVVTYLALGCSGPGDCDFTIGVGTASLVHALSDLKWLLVAVNVLMIVVLFFSARSEGVISVQRTRASRVSAPAPVGVIVVVALFLVLMALPAGGALDQVPDVLRGEFDNLRTGDDVWPAFASVAGLLLFMAVVYLVSRPGTEAHQPHPQEAATRQVLLGALALTVGLFGVHWAFDRTARGGVPTLAPLLVFATLWLTSLLVGRLRDVLAVSTAQDGEPPNESGPDAPQGYDPTFRARVVVALLVGGILTAAGIAAVRAMLPAIVANQAPDPLETTTFGLSLVIAALVSPAVVWLVYEVLRSPSSEAADDRWTRLAARVREVSRLRAVGAVVVVVTVVLTAWLMLDPSFGSRIGVPATLTIALSALCLLLGAVATLTRRRVWRATLQLHPGTRTPWMAMLVGVWILTNLMNTTGGYHDARTLPGTPTDRTLPQAFTSWSSQWDRAPSRCLVDGRVPLVLVAAPGGGGKAAYWTGIGMDALFSQRRDRQPTFCPGSLFAASGVSGGAVGLATRFAVPPASPLERLASDDSEHRSEPVLADMTDDDALAAAIGSMILRDLPASFASVRSGWRDRAAVLEDALAGDEPAFRSSDGTDGQKTVDDLGSGWWTDGAPILLLNGTSVGDGCRALMTNVRLLPDATSAGCLGEAPADSVGSISASVDVLRGLLPSTGASGGARGSNPGDLCHTEQPSQTLRATTASVLAARFPYVTPSGALRTCTKGNRTHATYVVDGGYLENTGMLSLLQLWGGTADLVTACNRAALGGAPVAGCPRGPDGRAAQIQPWFVLIENHYTSTKVPREASRPHESLVPVTTAAGKRSTTLGTAALVQALTVAANRDYGSGLACNFFLSLTAAKAPQVEAPLGWVLAPSTRHTMKRSMVNAYDDARRVHSCPPPGKR